MQLVKWRWGHTGMGWVHNPVWLYPCENRRETQQRGYLGKTRRHTGSGSSVQTGRDCSYVANSEECLGPPQLERGREGLLPYRFQWEHSPRTAWFRPPASRTVRQCTSVVLSHPFCGTVLWQPQKTIPRMALGRKCKKKKISRRNQVIFSQREGGEYETVQL